MSKSNMNTLQKDGGLANDTQYQLCTDLVVELDNFHRHLNDKGLYEKDRPDFIEEMDKQCPKSRDKDFIVGMLERDTSPVKPSDQTISEFTVYNIPMSSISKLKDADTERKVKFYALKVEPKGDLPCLYAGYAVGEDYIEHYAGYDKANRDPLDFLAEVIDKLGAPEDIICFNKVREDKSHGQIQGQSNNTITTNTEKLTVKRVCIFDQEYSHEIEYDEILNFDILYADEDDQTEPRTTHITFSHDPERNVTLENWSYLELDISVVDNLTHTHYSISESSGEPFDELCEWITLGCNKCCSSKYFSPSFAPGILDSDAESSQLDCNEEGCTGTYHPDR